MKESIIFVANGFTKENARLQPWRYVYELALYKSNSNEVYIITEGHEESSSEIWKDQLTIIKTNKLSIKKQDKLKNLILSLNPYELWWSTTPRTVAYYSLLSSMPCRCIAFITCPLYTWKELLKASKAKIPFIQTKALWTQRIIPRFLFKWMLNKSFISKVFVQSERNRKIMMSMGVDTSKVDLLPVGIDKEDLEPVDSSLIEQLNKQHDEIQDKVVYLYFGALRPIRGFWALLETLPDLVNKNPDVHLIILARGAEEEACKNLEDQLAIKNLMDNVTIIGGWLTRSEVWAYIELSDVAVLPFILVPSDIPIAVLEAMARGKPVVVSNVDGLPGMAIGRGLVIDPLNKKDFTEKLYQLSINDEMRTMLGSAAKAYMDEYPCWGEVGEMANNMLLKQDSRS